MAAATEKLQTMTLRQSAQPITGAANDYDRLMDRIGTARFILIGEASHGTFEFYQQRDAIILIDETRALEPLERSTRWESGEPPETYPTGL